MSVRLCPVSVINTARHELHSQGGLRDIYEVIFVSPLVLKLIEKSKQQIHFYLRRLSWYWLGEWELYCAGKGPIWYEL